jgi:urease accessory protein
VGGDELAITAHLEVGSCALLTSVAAQKVYGSIGRSRLAPQGRWAGQDLHVRLEAEADLEWLPQEVVLFEGGLFRQGTRVELAPGASFLGAEVVRLGRSGTAEGLGEGRWRSLTEIRRVGVAAAGNAAAAGRWELVERLELAGDSLCSPHGMAGEPVFGSLVWAAPSPLPDPQLEQLLTDCRRDRGGLPGEMACGALPQGLLARYRGPSSQAARFWFSRIWGRIRACRGLPPPRLPRVWPFQEEPFGPAGAAGRTRRCQS